VPGSDDHADKALAHLPRCYSHNEPMHNDIRKSEQINPVDFPGRPMRDNYSSNRSWSHHLGAITRIFGFKCLGYQLSRAAFQCSIHALSSVCLVRPRSVYRVACVACHLFGLNPSPASAHLQTFSYGSAIPGCFLHETISIPHVLVLHFGNTVAVGVCLVRLNASKSNSQTTTLDHLVGAERKCCTNDADRMFFFREIAHSETTAYAEYLPAANPHFVGHQMPTLYLEDG
jgi:hypothetical protein